MLANKMNITSIDELYLVKNLSIINLHGKDAHKWTERLYIPYSFEVLPKLILKTLDAFL